MPIVRAIDERRCWQTMLFFFFKATESTAALTNTHIIEEGAFCCFLCTGRRLLILFSRGVYTSLLFYHLFLVFFFFLLPCLFLFIFLSIEKKNTHTHLLFPSREAAFQTSFFKKNSPTHTFLSRFLFTSFPFLSYKTTVIVFHFYLFSRPFFSPSFLLL